MDAILVKSTTDKQEHAEQLARLLVAERLAACVQIVGPIQSVYRWQGEVATSREWQLWIKTRQADWEQVRRAIRQNHHYETPEIVALPAAAVDGDFLAWIMSETRHDA